MRFLSALILIALVQPVSAQWGGGSCDRSVATWHEVEKGVWYLGEPSCPKACWYPATDEYYEYTGGKWDGPKNPPWKKPLTGVDKSKCSGNDYIEVGGSESKEGRRKPKPSPDPEPPDGKLPADDSGKGFIVIIGDDTFIESAKLKLTAVSSKWFVEYFHPDDWQVKDLGYLPGAWLVGPRQANGRGVALSYSKTADNLTTALRKLDPSFDPAKVPDLSKEEILDSLRQVPPCAWAAAGVIVFMILTRKKEGVK